MATSHFEGEDVIVTIEKEDSGEVVNFEGQITNISMTGGSGEVESVRTFGGKSIQINKPTSEYEVSFDLVTRDSSFSEIQLTNVTTAGLPSSGTEFRSGNEAGKMRYRIIIWFLGDGAGYKSSSGVVVPKKVGEILRYIFKDAYSVSFEESMAADEYLKGTMTFKMGATDEDGYGNVFKEYTSNQGSDPLTVLNTTAHKGLLTWSTTAVTWTGGTTSTKYRV